MFNQIKHVFVAGAMFLCASQASAQTSEVSFSYTPAQLATERGATAAWERIRRITRRACANEMTIARSQPFRCQRDLRTQLVTKIGDARLASLAGLELPERRWAAR